MRRLRGLFDLSKWHLATKLSVAFTSIVLVLAAAISAFAIEHAIHNDQAGEDATLQDLASATAGRLDQFILDTEAAVETFAMNDEVETLLGWEEPQRSRVLERWKSGERDEKDPDLRVVRSVEDSVQEFYRKVKSDVDHFAQRTSGAAPSESELISVNIYDLEARIVASSRPDDNRTDPRKRKQRPNFRRPIEERPIRVYVSSLHRGQSRPNDSYVSFTRAVTGPGGNPIGLASFALDRALFGYMLRDLADPSLRPPIEDTPERDSPPNAVTACTPPGVAPGQREVFLVDRHGAVLMPRCAGSMAFTFMGDPGQEQVTDPSYEEPFQPMAPDDRIFYRRSPGLVDLITRALPREAEVFGDKPAGPAKGHLWRNDNERDALFTRKVSFDGTRSRLVAIHPVSEALEQGWHVVYTEDYADWITPIRRQYLRVFLTAFAAMGVLGSAILVLFVHLLTRQTRELHKGTVALAGGALQTRIPVLSKDELGELAASFNDMASRLGAAVDKAESERRRADEARAAAEVANQAKSTFLTNMSHELRTPLNAIIGYGEMLAENAESEQRAEEFSDLQNIVSSGKHLLDLVNELMDLAKIEAGKMAVHLEILDVPRLVSDVLALTQPLVEKNGNRLLSSVDPSARTVRADGKRLRQGLLNLVGNAAKFTEKGTIRLDVASEGQTVAFHVSDTGIGMTEAQMVRLFQPFMQAEDSTSRKYGGTGLGLTNTKNFCELMGGSVTVRSQHGAGSTFTIRLPAVAPVAALASKSSGEETSNERPILVVDDDPAMRDMMTRVLTKEGFRVVSTPNGEEALRLARDLEPVAITLDVIMPGMNGFQVLEALRADPATAPIPVVMVTMSDDKDRAIAFGAADALSKPVDWSRLAAVFGRLGVVSTAHPILVVEDDAASRSLLRRLLEKAGWHVAEAENGKVALEWLQSKRPAVVLLDLMMPEVDGFELMAQLRDRPNLRDIPIVIVTARELTEGDRERLTENVRRVLQKGDYSREQLVTQVREVMAEWAGAFGRARTGRPPPPSLG